MWCFLCSHDTAADAQPDYVEVHCPKCGCYRISRWVIEDLANHRLNISKTREYVRQQTGGEEKACAEINPNTAIWSDYA